MREIKFRGKRISNDAWVYGGIYNTYHPNYDSDCYAICADGKDYFVEQSTIGQFTGLHDNNGKEIYEGDVVKVFCDCGGYFTDNKEILGVIQWNDIFACWSISYEHIRSGQDESLCNQIENIEVIGNIYDNPNL